MIGRSEYPADKSAQHAFLCLHIARNAAWFTLRQRTVGHLLIDLFQHFTAQNLAYLAGGFYVAGLAITNQIALRLFLLAGTITYVAYYATVSESPLYEAIYVSLMIGAANLGGLTSLLIRQSRLVIPRAHADIYGSFPDIPPGAFRALVRLSHRYKLKSDKQLTVEGMPGSKLYYVVQGETLAQKNGEAFALPSGIFLGEVAFLTGAPSSASTWLEEGAEVLEWRFDVLERKCARSPRFKLALEAAISTDLAAKVASSMGHGSRPVAQMPDRMRGALEEVGRA